MSDYSIFPTAIDGYAQLPLFVDNITPVNAEGLNRIRSAIINIENALGIIPQGEYQTVSERLDNIDSGGLETIIERLNLIEAELDVVEATLADFPSDLATVLAAGNVTGGSNIILSTGDGIEGESRVDITANSGDINLTSDNLIVWSTIKISDNGSVSGIPGQLVLPEIAVAASNPGAGSGSVYVDTGTGGRAELFYIDDTGASTQITDLGSVSGGTGDVSGPASSVNNTIVRFDSTTGKIIKGGAASDGVILDDSGNLYPETANGGSLGTASNEWSDLFLTRDGAVIDFDSIKITKSPSAGAQFLEFSGALAGYNFTGGHIGAQDLLPLAANTYSLGSAGLTWQRLRLDSGSNITFGSYSITESSGALTFTGTIRPTVNDGAALGSGTVSWSDLFLAAGAQISFNNGDVSLQNTAANELSFLGAGDGYKFNNGAILLDNLFGPPNPGNGWGMLYANADYSNTEPQITYRTYLHTPQNSREYALSSSVKNCILHAVQVDSFDQIRQAAILMFSLVAPLDASNPDTITISDGTTTETWTAVAGAPAAFQFDVGANGTSSTQNLATAINNDSTLWGAEYIANGAPLNWGSIHPGFTNGIIIIYRKSQLTTTIDDRIYGSLSNQPRSAHFDFSGNPDYSQVGNNAADSPIPSSDPGVRNFGYGSTNSLDHGDVVFSILDRRQWFKDDFNSDWIELGVAPPVPSDSYSTSMAVSPGNTVNEFFFVPYDITLEEVNVYCDSGASSAAGIYTLAVEDIDGSNNLLSAATFNMETPGSGGSLSAATLTSVSLTATSADLNMTKGTKIRVQLVSSNIDLIADGVYIQLIYRSQ